MSYQSLLSWFSRHWRMFVYVFNVCRFSALVLAAGTALLFAGQGQDLLLSTAEDNRYMVLLVSVLMWAFSIWLWTRTLLEIKFPTTPKDDAALLAVYRRRTPRVLGVLPFVVFAWALYSAGDPATHYVWHTIAAGVAFAVFVVYRRRAGQQMAKWTSPAEPAKSFFYVEQIEDNKSPLRESLWSGAGQGFARGLGTWDWAAMLILVVGVVMFIWGMTNPLSMGNRFNALILLMAWGATFLPLGSFISYYGNVYRLPVVTFLIVLALVSSFWNDNHAIRPLAGDAVARRVSASAALDAWAKAHCKPVRKGEEECGPLVVVATAGGGIRAAYWTGTVLGTLHDTIPGFDDRVFAISGISGGSVGAAVYRAVATGGNEQCAKSSIFTCTTNILSHDYLSPLSASLLYPDMVQRFIPWSFLPDRAKTFETAWEQTLKEKAGTAAFGQSFAALGGPTQQPWPALFLNATRSENGRRLVAASVRIDGEPAFQLAGDQLSMLGYDIRFISAAHNSARFPYVSPPGSWHQGKGDDKTAGKIVGRLQDGGLFENYGADTALEILRLAETQLKDKGKRFTPVVVQISGDPTLPENLAPSPKGPVSNFAYEVFTTLRTVFATRVAHGDEAAVQLKEWALSPREADRGKTSEPRGKYVYFRMCDHNRTELDPPLGWSLSSHAEKTIQGYLLNVPVPDNKDKKKPDPPTCRAGNQAGAAELHKLLGDRIKGDERL